MADKSPTVGVILVAAGSGQRMGAKVPKAFLELDGRRLVDYALERIRASSLSAQIVVVVPAGYESAIEPASDLVVVVGGATRHESVSVGLAALTGSVTTVLVHDAARALMPSDVFDAVADEVDRTGDGSIPALAVVDALRTYDEATHLVTGVVNRDQLRAVQTPQGFVRANLELAHGQAPGGDHHDDAALYVAAGFEVRALDGDVRGFKITHPSDIERALQILHPEGRNVRVGTGIDVHAFGSKQGLHLAGLLWPDELELEGHSDGDSAAHAIVDALLAAANLGDIGGMVGTDDPALAGAHGDVFIREAVRRVREAGFVPINVTVQIIGNRPKLASRRAEAERELSGWVGAPVSVSATTSDGLGITGEGGGIAAVATALIAVV